MKVVDVNASFAHSSAAQSGNIAGVAGGGGSVKGYVWIIVAVLAVVAVWLWKKR